MALPGELAGFNSVACSCNEQLELQVCYSMAGYYLGYFCPRCGPYSRETGYFKTKSEAEAQLEIALRGEVPEKARDTEYHP